MDRDFGYPGSILATIALMRMETYAYEQKPSSVIDASANFFDRFGDTPEATLSMYWTGKALYDVVDYDGSARLLDSLVEAKFVSARRFKNFHVTRSIAQLSAQVHEKMGSHARAEEIRRMVFD